MLKYNRIISLLLSLVMVMSLFSVSVSADWLTEDDSDAIPYEGEEEITTEITEDGKVTYDYSSVVATLKALGIIDDKIVADATISRSNFAAEMIHVLNVGDSLSGVVSNVYNDVDESTNNAGEISACYELGIMNGYTNGDFGPEDTLTFGQAVKSIVCLLGYGVMNDPDANMAEYLVTANRYKITKRTVSGIDEAVTGGEIAQMIFNALEVSILNRTSSGVINHYSNEADDTILKRHDISRIEGIVYANDITALSDASAVKDGRVKVGSTICNAGETDIAAALGCYIKAYAITDEYGEAEPQIIYYEVTSKNEIAELDSDKILSVTTNGDMSRTVSYEEGKSEIKVTVAKKAHILYQNVADPYYDLADVKNLTNGVVKFIDNDGDGEYDVVSVKEYTTSIVESIGASNYNVNTDNGSIALDPMDKSYSFIITKNGVAAEFSAIEVGDVLSVALGTALDGTVVKEVNASNNKITGTVNEITNDGTYDYILVGINEIKVLPTMKEAVNVGVNGTFYLDFRGNAAKVKASAGSSQFGYVMGLMNEKGISECAKLKILAADGAIREYKTKNTVSLDGSGKVEGKSLTTAGNKEKIYRQLIQFKTNYDGEITDIVTKYNPAQNAEGGLALYQEEGITDASGIGTTLIYRQYNSNVPLFFIGNPGGTINNYAGIEDLNIAVSEYVGKDDTIRINNDTLVFVVPLDEDGADEKNYSVNTKAYFKNRQFYYTEMFNVDEDTLTANVVLVRKSALDEVASDSVPAMVSNLTRKIDELGVEYYEVALVDKSGVHNYRVSENLIERTDVLSGESDMSPKLLKVGDVVRYTLYENEIEKIERVLAYSKNITSYSENGNYRAEPAYTVGEVLRIEGTIVTLQYLNQGEYRIRHYETSPVKNIVIYDALGNGGKGEARSGTVAELEIGNTICLRSSDGYVTSVFGFIQDK